MLLAILVYTVLGLIGISVGLDVYTKVKKIVSSDKSVNIHVTNFDISDKAKVENFFKDIGETLKKSGMKF